MENHSLPEDHPKRRRRRRRVDRLAISARLILDDYAKASHVGLLSDDLFTDLFRQPPFYDTTNFRYIAICPWAPLSIDIVANSTWTILPVRAQNPDDDETKKLLPGSIRFSASSPALQSFVEALQIAAGTRSKIKAKAGIEIRVFDVVPLQLETVYVSVDGHALRKHDEVQKKFGGGFGARQTNNVATKGKAKLQRGVIVGPSTQGQEDRLTATIREALTNAMVARQGDLLPLLLPAHPITHVPLTPAKIILCEPVSQGLLSPDTKIVVNQLFREEHKNPNIPRLKSIGVLRRMIMEEDEDTSNDQFFSAVEDGGQLMTPTSEADPQTSDSDVSEIDNGSLSDDSLDNLISMTTPVLPTQSSSMFSSMTASTPRVEGSITNGVTTPGSVYSSFTTTTTRPGSEGVGRLFEAKGLLSKISDDLLHPKPTSEEDDEARIFVNIKLLVKLGCFAGDWVKVEAVSHGAGLWNSDSFENDDEVREFRPVKVYGLPDPPTSSYLRSSGRKAGDRRSSFAAAHPKRQLPTAWLSPILLFNIGQPAQVRLSPLSSASQNDVSFGSKYEKTKIKGSSAPPIAREVTLLKVPNFLSTERALQTALLAGLKQHFEYKRRILRKGDLVCFSIDIGVGRMVTQSTATADVDFEIEDLLSMPPIDQTGNANLMGVAWFRVGQVLGSVQDQNQRISHPDFWGGVVSIEPMTTRTAQAGSEHSKVPSVLQNTWESYLGVGQKPKAPRNLNSVEHSIAQTPKSHVSALRRRLRELIAAATSSRAVHLGMKPMVILLHSTQRNIGKAHVVLSACLDLGVHTFPIDAYDILTEGGAGGGDVKTEAFLELRVKRALSCGPEFTVLLLRHVEALTADRMVSALRDITKEIRVLVATTTDIDNVSEGVRSLFTHELELSAPDEGEREQILLEIIESRGAVLACDVDLGAIAIKTASLVAGDLVDVVERAIVARQNRLETLVSKHTNKSGLSSDVLIRDILISGGGFIRCITKADFDLAVDAARKNFADAIGAPKIPNVSWDDVGGLENVKDAVMETIQLPLERPELFAKGMKKRSGILFYGPPGTGKTLLAKAIATEFSLNFFSVKGPELLNMYIGESEANVRRVFQRARDARPCVVFFDELDSVAPKRGNQGDSGGVMDRIVSQLLAELDGMSDGEEGAGGVFVIGATNRPDLLDQALLRPGRFDKMLYLGISDTHDKQLTILEALTRKFDLHPDMSLRRVADSLPFTYTGADLYALCSDAMLKAITRQASAVDAKIQALSNGPVTTAYFFDHLATKDDIAVMVTEEDFLAAQRELVGSVR